MLWKKLCGKVEEEILDKLKVEEDKDPEVEREVLGQYLFRAQRMQFPGE